MLPPVPSDAAVALGAFLSHRGVTRPLAVFLVTWIANLLGAAGVYLAARRYGRRLFATPTGRRLLAPRSLALIEREYLRLGTGGHLHQPFPARHPRRRAAIRGAGRARRGADLRAHGARVRDLVRRHHHPRRASSAPSGPGSSALYRGRQSHARHRHAGAGGRPGRGLVPLAAGGSAGASGCGMRRETRSSPAAPSFLAGTDIAEGSAREAAALVVLELAYADPVLTPDERTLIAEHLHARWGLGAPGTPPTPAAGGGAAHPLRRLRRPAPEAGGPRRSGSSWSSACGRWPSPTAPSATHEARLMHLAAELLGISPADLAEVSRRLRARVRRHDGARGARPRGPRLRPRGLPRLPRARVRPQRQHGRSLPARPAAAGGIRARPRACAIRGR